MAPSYLSLFPFTVSKADSLGDWDGTLTTSTECPLLSRLLLWTRVDSGWYPLAVDYSDLRLIQEDTQKQDSVEGSRV